MSRIVPASLLVFAVLLGGAPGYAQKAWDRHKGDCETVLSSSEQVTLARLNRCASLWEAYRDVTLVDANQRRRVVPAFERLVREGDAAASFLAREALLRLGVVPPAPSGPRDSAASSGASGTTREASPGASRHAAGAVSEADRKAAEQVRIQGMARYKKKDWDGALALFAQALERDPGNVQALYDAACSAALAGRAAESIGYLERLAANGSKPALAKVRKSWRDRDFDGIRSEPGFKRATGWARIKVVNGLDDALSQEGDDNCFKLVELLGSERLGFAAVQGGGDRYVRDRPHIWYQPHAKASAFVVREVIGHPRTRVVPIDWFTDWDLVVSWSDRPEIDDSGRRAVRHSMLRKDATGKSPEQRLDGAIQSKDEALATPDAYISKTEKLVSEPGKTADKVGRTVDRAAGTVDKAKRSVEKVKGVFK